MNIEFVPITDLKPYETNPRILTDGAVQAVADSIKEFGWKQPIVVDTDSVIVAGHTRFKAAELLGLEAVPILRADDLTPEQVKMFRLTDNRTSEMTGWDVVKLADEIRDMPGIPPGFLEDELETLRAVDWSPGTGETAQPASDYTTIRFSVLRQHAKEIRAKCAVLIQAYTAAD